MKVKAGLALAIVIVMGFVWASTRDVTVEYPTGSHADATKKTAPDQATDLW